VALAIPTSMLLSFVVLALGITMNMVVLFSLILALGMLVDNAIVIVENIYRYVEEGWSPPMAARKATGEVALPVIAATATTLAAFAPLLFWPDVAGEFMKYLPLTLIITLSSSLFVALVIVPTLCAIFLKPEGRPSDP
jgi:multidrug efflux pump